jgi:hypothetical protein
MALKKRITLATVLKHMQQMNQTMLKEFSTVKTDMGILKQDMKEVKRGLFVLNRKFDTAIPTMDKRLDNVEADVIDLKKAVGIR